MKNLENNGESRIRHYAKDEVEDMGTKNMKKSARRGCKQGRRRKEGKKRFDNIPMLHYLGEHVQLCQFRKCSLMKT